MQELRQGAWLLWDAFAPYGVLSILISTLFPGNAWQSFYLFQGICDAVVALLMFQALGGTRSSPSRIILATALFATTLFFRPRSATLLLAGQMTPFGGPVRFIWPFVMLAYLVSYYSKSARRDSRDDRADWPFELRGHLIWLGSVCWSVESAIYCSAVWFPAYALYLMQRASDARRNRRTRSEAARLILRSVSVPLSALVLLVGWVTLCYVFVLGYLADWTCYFEYALLYGGGFAPRRSILRDRCGSPNSLPVGLDCGGDLSIPRPRPPASDGSCGRVGRRVGNQQLLRFAEPRGESAEHRHFPRICGSDNTSRIADPPKESWHGLVRVAFVPMIVAPVALTVAHPSFVREITTPQLSYESFTEQIPLMEPSLNQLLLEAGAKPSDPVVRIGDARLTSEFARV